MGSFRNIIFAAFAAFICSVALAAPASRRPFDYVQPDGSVIRIRLHGDEFFSWTTDMSTGQVVTLGEDGWYRPSVIDEAARRAGVARRQAADSRRSATPMRRGAGPLRTHSDNPLTHGERHVPVLLFDFPDQKFSLEDPRAEFDALFNQHGYSAYGSTGSVRDYYVDNSDGQFTPVFDVYGPVELPNECFTFYGKGSYDKTDQALVDGARLLDAEIDFSRYDYDNDGVVDMVLYVFAGYGANEAGIPVSTHIWPSESDIDGTSLGRNNPFDGKYLGKFGCTPELYGAGGKTICGIGLPCHEFAHTLGLPDFYPVGEADQHNGELYEFSLMCSGNYLNECRTPGYLTAIERIMLGWMTEDDILVFPDGEVSFGSVSGSVAYKDPTETEGECFIFECRDGSGWDAYLPEGMVVYHVDRSGTIIRNGRRACDLWANGTANNIYGHPCFYVVPAGFQSSSFYDEPDRSKFVFPGSLGISTYSPVGWGGNPTGLVLSGISYSSGERKVFLTASYTNGKLLKGTVTGQSGRGIGGVHVTIGDSHSTVSDDDGHFDISFEKEFEGTTVHITLSKEGYKTTGTDVNVESHVTFFKASMQKEDETDLRVYRYYDPTAPSYPCGLGTTNSQMAAIRIPAAELDANGGSVLTVTFSPYLFAEAYYIVVDEGDERLLTYKLPKSLERTEQTFDLYSLGVDFSGKEDLYVGIAIEDCESDYNDPTKPFEGFQGAGHFYLSSFNLQRSEWKQLPNRDLGLYVSTVGHTAPRPPKEISSLADMGFNSIADPGNGSYTAGSAFALELELAADSAPRSVSWFFDGNAVSGSGPVTLPTGTHTVAAILKHPDGSTETLELTLDVK